MPIRAEFRHLYRHEWLTVIRPRVLARAHQQCERCRKPLTPGSSPAPGRAATRNFLGPGATT
jgi:hypothetical protein